MIFAELDYPEHYSKIHDRLASHIYAVFRSVESGHQSDSWFWIHDGEQKVKIDTFSSMKHQVKSAQAGLHVQRVIELLRKAYKVKVYAKPQLEPHEES